MQKQLNRITIFSATLVAAIFMLTACTAASDVISTVTPSGEQFAVPTSVITDDNLSEAASIVEPVADALVEKLSSEGTAGDGSDVEDLVDDLGLDPDAIAEQLGLDPDALTDALDIEDIAEQLGLDVDADGNEVITDEDGGAVDASDFFADFFASFQNSAMEQSLEAALVPSECAAFQTIEYPAGYYTGSLIDTHLHMPPLNDDPTGDGESYGGAGGVDAELYDSIDPNDRPLLGTTTTLDEVACALRQEGSTKAFTFFPVYDDASDALIELAYNAVDRHGELFVPFIQSTSSEISTVEAEVLVEMLGKRPDLFVGFGEVGDSPTEPVNLPPDAPIYVGDFEVAQDYGLLVYFHPGVGDHENLGRALKMFPEVTFLVHGDFVRPYIGDLMAENSNVYYTFNDIFDEVTPQFRFGDKQDFIDAMERDWEPLLDQAMVHYEDLINTYPDRFMWGTDRADIVWNYHADIGQLLVKFGRDFIGRLDPAVQDKVAYQNAESLLQ
ncbi:MAG: amidohydrolase family protein [Chloroflexi bacterium]|nr:amidohydrolase family protein [Chloroflexota bacterium]MBT4072481.1 amidohydrolase family protein [Chloroflexota bacterium]MBT4514108.1 amidohydrolase family protein [Chloroflexota bacterium]MBT6681659.1 amidohydrolase family protein [Chloroflexota bacterium]